MKDKSKYIAVIVTVSVHLAVILVLMLCVVNPAIEERRQAYMVDFSKQEEIEKARELIRKREAAQRRVDRMLDEAGVPVEQKRSLASNRDASLKDDRQTDAEQLYKDAERIEQEYRELMAGDDNEVTITTRRKEKVRQQEEAPQYSGPTVLSYSLSGRKGSSLPIPAYKCIGEGEVTVIIIVDAAGNVTDAKIQDEVSSTDRCLRSYALKAARASRFSVSPTGAARQSGNIVYSFIAQ